MSLQRGINLRALAEKMGQCSGAEVRGICTEAGTLFLFVRKVSRADGSLSGMYALRERRQHVTQEDFEFAVAKVRMSKTCVEKVLTVCSGSEEEPRGKHVCEQAILIVTFTTCCTLRSLSALLA
jgi:ATP-dependent 26S proteasome regulatory subunit